MVVFLVSGLWHGANWTFVIWGGLHGSYYLFSFWTRNFRPKLISLFKLNKFPFLYKLLQVLFTFHIVLFAWIFFRANSLSDAIFIVTHLFTDIGSLISNIITAGNGVANFGFALSKPDMVIAAAAIGILGIHHLLQRGQSVRVWLSSKPIWLRWSVYYALIFGILVFGYFDSSEFIYFQF